VRSCRSITTSGASTYLSRSSAPARTAHLCVRPRPEAAARGLWRASFSPPGRFHRLSVRFVRTQGADPAGRRSGATRGLAGHQPHRPFSTGRERKWRAAHGTQRAPICGSRVCAQAGNGPPARAAATATRIVSYAKPGAWMKTRWPYWGASATTMFDARARKSGTSLGCCVVSTTTGRDPKLRARRRPTSARPS
jgi:hypothetical protein